MDHGDEPIAEELDYIAISIIVLSVSAEAVCILRLLHGVRKYGLSPARRLLVQALGLPSGKPRDPELHDQISALLIARRLQCSRVLTYALWICFCATSFQLVVKESEPQSIVDRHIGVPLIRVAYLLLFTLVVVWDAYVFKSIRLARLLHIVSMAGLCFSLFVDMDEDQIHIRYDVVLMCSLMMAGLYPCFPVLCMTNGVLAVCGVVSQSMLDTEWIQNVMSESVILSIKLSLMFGVCSIMENYARRHVEASSGKCHQSAVSALLDLMCDAVVVMDEKMRLQGRCAKLGVMLMHGPERSLQGDTLSAFIPDSEERDHFERVLRQSSWSGGGLGGSSGESAAAPGPGSGRSQGLAALGFGRSLTEDESNDPSSEEIWKKRAEELTPSMLSLRLRDSIGNKIPVVLFHVPYVSVGGHTHHLLGLREDLDPYFRSNVAPAGGPGAAEGRLRPEYAQRLQEIIDRHGRHGTPLDRNGASPSADAAAAAVVRGGAVGGADGGGAPGHIHGTVRGATVQVYGRTAVVDAARAVCNMSERANSRASSRSRAVSSAASSRRRNRPNLSRTIEVFLAPKLPIRWISTELEDDLRVRDFASPSADGGASGAIYFGALLLDGGTKLAAKLQDEINNVSVQGRSGNFVRDLGIWDIALPNWQDRAGAAGESEAPQKADAESLVKIGAGAAAAPGAEGNAKAAPALRSSDASSNSSSADSEEEPEGPPPPAGSTKKRQLWVNFFLPLCGVDDGGAGPPRPFVAIAVGQPRREEDPQSDARRGDRRLGTVPVGVPQSFTVRGAEGRTVEVL